MNEPTAIIAITMNGDNPTVSGRDLHERLGIETPYKKWFDRMCEYGFEEAKDFATLVGQKCPTNNPKNPWTEVTDHEITLDMAKQICMIQRTEIGRAFREYFLEVERKWNSPESVMARALQMSKATLERVTAQLSAANDTIAALQPKADYYDRVLSSKGTTCVTIIAKHYGMTAKAFNQMLHDMDIQYRSGKTWVLTSRYHDKGYTEMDTNVHIGSDGREKATYLTKWTQQGIEFLYYTLKENGVIPTAERGVAS